MKKKESKFVGLEHMANRVQSSHDIRKHEKASTNTSPTPVKPKKKEINPITGRAD